MGTHRLFNGRRLVGQVGQIVFRIERMCLALWEGEVSTDCRCFLRDPE
jgi:hypothetical protein